MNRWSSEMIKVTIFFTFMAVVCGGLLYLAVRSWGAQKQEKQRATAMQTWPVTTGTARKWEVYPTSRSRGRYTFYQTKITYAYYVEAKDYLIAVLDKRFGYNGAVDKEEAKKDAEAFAQSIVERAQQIHIYFNPQDPSDSSAEIKDIGAISFTGLAIVIIVLSLFLLVFLSFPMIALGMVGYKLFLHFTGR